MDQRIDGPFIPSPAARLKEGGLSLTSKANWGQVGTIMAESEIV